MNRFTASESGRRIRAVVVASGAVLLSVLPVSPWASVAAAAATGSELLVVPGTTRPLASGGSTTPYGVALPSGASCPGDTAHHGYHVFSYLVPPGASPTAVSFRTGVPDRWYGYIANGAYYGAVNTAESTGQIVGLPIQFVWTRLTPQILFPTGRHTASWSGGIACADTHGQVTDYWNSTLRFTADSSDAHGFTWTTVDQGAAPTALPVGELAGVALMVLAAGAAAYALVLRRRGRSSDAGGDGPDAGEESTDVATNAPLVGWWTPRPRPRRPSSALPGGALWSSLPSSHWSASFWASERCPP